MDTEMAEPDTNQGEQHDEDGSNKANDESDEDEASVLSYLTDDDPDSNCPVAGSTPPRSIDAQSQQGLSVYHAVRSDRTSSLPDHDIWRRGRTGYNLRNSATPTASLGDTNDNNGSLHDSTSVKVLSKSHPVFALH